MKRFLFAFICVCQYFLGNTVFAGDPIDRRPTKNILLIASYHLNDDWTEELTSSIIQHTEELPFSLNYEISTLDALRIGDVAIRDQIFLQNLPALKKGSYSMIVALDDVAVDTVLRHAQEIPADIPIVFAGYENDTQGFKTRYPNLTGVSQNLDIDKNVEIGLKLFPKTSHIMVLADPKRATDIIAECKNAHGKVQFLSLSEDTKNTHDIFQQLENLPPDTLVLFVPWREICNDDYHSIQAFATDLSQTLNRPYLISLDPFYGYGGLGGYGASAMHDGRQAADLIRRVLQTGSAVNIPLEEGAILPSFDLAVLNRYHLDANRLPQDSIFHNQTPPIWSSSEVQWILAITLCSLLFASMLIYILIKRKEVQRRYALFNRFPGSIGVVNRNGDILYLNTEASKQYSPGPAGNLRDFAGIDHTQTLAAVRKALTTGNKVTFDYASEEIKHSVTVSPLPQRLFGEDTAIWVAMDNSELQSERTRAEQYALQLKQTTKLWDGLLNTLPLHIFAKDVNDDFKYVFCNKALCDFLGHPLSEVVGKSNAELFPIEDREKLRLFDKQSVLDLERGINKAVVTQVSGVNGERKMVRLVKNIFVADDGRKLLLGAAIDITELEEALTQAREYAEQLERTTTLWNSLLNSLPVHIFAKNPDDGMKYVFSNKTIEEFLGVKNTDIIGKDATAFFPADTAKEIIRVDSQLSNSQEAFLEQNVAFNDRQGKYHYFRTLKRVIAFGPSERLILGMAIDITEVELERQKNEKLNSELSDLLAQNAILLDNMHVYVFTKDIDDDLRYLSCNKACSQVLGKPINEIIGKTDYELLGNHELANLYKNISLDAIETGELQKILPFHIRDGQSRIGEFYMKKLTLFNGKNCLFCLCVDITEREELRKEQETSLQTLRQLIDSMPCYVVAKDINDNLRYTVCNQFFQNMVGVSEAQIIGHFAHEIFTDPDDFEANLRWDMEAIQSNSPTEHIMTFTGKKGKQISHAHRIPLQLSGGRNWLFIVGDDITEFEKAKRLAEENAERLHLTLNSIGDGVIATDAKGNIVLLNPVAERMTGYDASEAIGLPHEQIFKIFSNDDDTPSPSPVTRTLRTGTIVELANHTDLVAKDGQRYHISDSAAPILNKSGKIIGAILVFRDVTEEYLQRDQMRRTVAMMEAGAEATQAAAFFCDVTAGNISGSKLLNKLLPIENGTMPDNPEWIIPEDRPKVYEAWHRLKQGEIDSFTIDYRVDKDGEIRFHRLRSFLEERRQNVLRTFGVIQDITDITRKANELHTVSELWKQSVNFLPMMFSVKDVDDDFRYITCNNLFADSFGFSPEKIIGSTDQELFAGNSWLPTVLRQDHDAVSNHTTAPFEESVIAINGHEMHLRTFLTHAVIGDKRLLIRASTDINDLHYRIAIEKVSNNILAQVAAEHDFKQLQNFIANEILQRIKADRVVLTQYTTDKSLDLVQEWYSNNTIPLSALDLQLHKNVWNQLASQLVQGTKIVQIDDFFQNAITAVLAQDPRYKTRAAIIAPIEVGGEFWGCLFVAYENKQRIFSDIDAILMENCAHVISLSLMHSRQNQALRNALHDQQTILDNIKLPILFYDGQGKLLKINREMEQVIQQKATDVTSEQLTAFFKDALNGKGHPVEDAIRTQKLVTFEIVHGNREYIVNTIPVLSSANTVINVVQCAYEVTALNALIRSQEIYSFCLEVFFKEENLEAALEAIIEKVCNYMHASRVFIVRYDNHKHTSYGYIEYSANNTAPITKNVEMPLNTGTWYQKFTHDDRLIISQFSDKGNEELLGDWHPIFKIAKVCSLYNAGLTYNGELWGDFGIIYENAEHEFTKSELDFLTSVTPQINLLLQKSYAKQELLLALAATQYSEQEKTKMLQNEKLLNACLSIITEQDDSIDNAFHAVLKLLTYHFNGSGSSILQISEEEKIQFCKYEHAMDNRSYSFDKNQIYPFSSDSKWFKKLQKDGIFFAPDLANTQQFSELDEWASIAISRHIRALYTAAIHFDGKIWGLLSIAYRQDNPTTITDEQAKLLCSVAHLLEILLQRKHTHDRLVSAKEQAQAADRAKSFFIASISHEIRTPLNSIIGFSELLSEGGISEKESVDYLHSISCSGTALLELVNDVLDLSKLEAKQLQLIEEPTNFTELAADVMQIFTIRAKNKGLALQLDIPRLPLLLLDKIRIRQILVNLIGNAVKFTNAGSIKLTAKFDLNQDNKGSFLFAVTDTGIGIPEKDLSKLMVPFVQLSNMRGTNAVNNGTGLGLAITKRLLEQMGGKIWVESIVDKGSTFHIELHNVATVTADVTEKSMAAATVEAVPVAPVTYPILLVDDVQMNLKVMSAMCRKLGFSDIVMAESGEGALKLLETQSFSMILTDMWMPGMTGSELAARIRGQERHAKLPIYAVTADVETKDNFPMEHFNGVLLKPISLEKLKEVLHSANYDGGNA